MPRRIEWTAGMDAAIINGRAAHRSWDVICAAIGVSRWSAIERGKRLGALRLLPPVAREEPVDEERDPLPPGHPETWGAIIAGTCLAGSPYPSRVFTG